MPLRRWCHSAFHYFRHVFIFSLLFFRRRFRWFSFAAIAFMPAGWRQLAAISASDYFAAAFIAFMLIATPFSVSFAFMPARFFAFRYMLLSLSCSFRHFAADDAIDCHAIIFTPFFIISIAADIRWPSRFRHYFFHFIFFSFDISRHFTAIAIIAFVIDYFAHCATLRQRRLPDAADAMLRCRYFALSPITLPLFFAISADYYLLFHFDWLFFRQFSLSTLRHFSLSLFSDAAPLLPLMSFRLLFFAAISLPFFAADFLLFSAIATLAFRHCRHRHCRCHAIDIIAILPAPLFSPFHAITLSLRHWYFRHFHCWYYYAIISFSHASGDAAVDSLAWLSLPLGRQISPCHAHAIIRHADYFQFRYCHWWLFFAAIDAYARR